MKTKKWLYTILACWLTLVMAFGMWWLYLIFKLGGELEALQSSTHQYSSLIRMLKLEGTSFIIVMFLGGCFAFWVYLRDLKKSRSIQAFFSSLTHELKTPLASMKLQAQVIEELTEERYQTDQQLKTLISRLLQDSQSLEVQMDKALQLARVEQGAQFTLAEISLKAFIEKICANYKEVYQFEIDIPTSLKVLADQMALELIFKNFIENTKRHQPQARTIKIRQTSQSTKSKIQIIYDDQGHEFKGNLDLLGTLFYKHNSSQGTGVGLYLCTKLASAIQGNLTFQKSPNLQFFLTLKQLENRI